MRTVAKRVGAFLFGAAIGTGFFVGAVETGKYVARREIAAAKAMRALEPPPTCAAPTYLNTDERVYELLWAGVRCVDRIEAICKGDRSACF